MTRWLFRLKVSALLPVLLLCLLVILLCEAWEGAALYVRLALNERWPVVLQALRAIRKGERTS